jgi:hypothetical protein
MTCAAYYEDYPPGPPQDRRCDIRAVDTATAMQVSIIGITNTLTGVFNLFVAGWLIKRHGPWLALLVQTVFSMVRIGANIVGVVVGSRAGIITMQLSQFIGIFGRPGGAA